VTQLPLRHQSNVTKFV